MCTGDVRVMPAAQYKPPCSISTPTPTATNKVKSSAKKRAKQRRIADKMHNLAMHEMYGHKPMPRLRKLSEQKLVDGLELKGDGKIGFCETCAQMKAKKPKYKKSTRTRSTKPGERIHSDLKEAEVRSHSGHKWMISFVCDATRRGKHYYLKKKSDAWIAFKKYVEEELDPLGRVVRYLRIDGGSEYGKRGECYTSNSKFKSYLKSKPQNICIKLDRAGNCVRRRDSHIQVERAPPYSAPMNGVAERYNQTIWDLVRCILRDQKRGKKHWPHAARFAELIRNVDLTTALEGETPYRKWHGKNPDQSLWQKPLCDVYAYVEGKNRKSLDERRKKYVYVGIATDSPCYLCYDPATKQTVERRYAECVFHDSRHLNEIRNASAADRGGDSIGSGGDTGTNRVQSGSTCKPDSSSSSSSNSSSSSSCSNCKCSSNSNSNSSNETDTHSSSSMHSKQMHGATDSHARDDSNSTSSNSGGGGSGAGKERNEHRTVDETISKLIVRNTSNVRLLSRLQALQKLWRSVSAVDQLSGVRSSSKRRRDSTSEVDTDTAGDAEGDGATPNSIETSVKKSRRQQSMRQAPGVETGVSSRGRTLRTPSATLPQSAFRAVSLKEKPLQEHALQVGDKVYAFNARAGVVLTPKSIKQALASEQRELWMKAIREEWDGLWNAGCFEAVDYSDVPAGMRIMNLLWQFKVKPDRFKARCCTNGKQEDPDDYGDIFAPVCRMTSFRTLLWKAANEGWGVGQCDVHMAYVCADNEREQYVHCPPEFNMPGKCLRVRKMLYGLHGSGKAWHSLFKSWMLSIGFRVSEADECVFIRGELRVCLYVDDCMYTGPDAELARFKQQIDKRFKVRHLDGTEYLGLEIQRNKKEGWIRISQKKYIEKILKRFGFSDCKPKATPMAQGKPLPRLEGKCEDSELQSLYRSMVGSLMFLSTSSRPDISFCVKELSRHLVHPSELHVQAAGRCFRYLRGTADYTLNYNQNRKAHFHADAPQKQRIYGSADADFAGEWETAKSTTGYGFSGGSGVLTWRAGTQSIVTHSSTEAELVALDESVRELQHLRQILKDFGVDVYLPVTIFEDNLSTIAIVKSGRFNPRSKHINVRYHYCHNLQEEGVVKLVHLATDKMPSDVLNKALARREHERHTRVLLGHAQIEGV